MGPRLPRPGKRGNQPSAIEIYDQTRDAIFPVTPERQRHLYGEADFYGWSEGVARQLSVPERPEFRAFLKARGFALD